MNSKESMKHILIVENLYRPGVGLLIAKLFRSEQDPDLVSLVIDTDEVDASLIE